MEILHALVAVLSAFRLVTLFTQDAIWQPVRVRFQQVPWHCALCMSVWAGIAATVFLLALPWANWPLAMSWAYLAYKRQDKMTDNKEVNARIQAMADELRHHVAMGAQRSADIAAELASAKLTIATQAAEIEKLKQPKEA